MNEIIYLIYFLQLIIFLYLKVHCLNTYTERIYNNMTPLLFVIFRYSRLFSSATWFMVCSRLWESSQTKSDNTTMTGTGMPPSVISNTTNQLILLGSVIQVNSWMVATPHFDTSFLNNNFVIGSLPLSHIMLCLLRQQNQRQWRMSLYPGVVVVFYCFW